jgi:hypothetical protein
MAQGLESSREFLTEMVSDFADAGLISYAEI